MRLTLTAFLATEHAAKILRTPSTVLVAATNRDRPYHPDQSHNYSPLRASFDGSADPRYAGRTQRRRRFRHTLQGWWTERFGQYATNNADSSSASSYDVRRRRRNAEPRSYTRFGLRQRLREWEARWTGVDSSKLKAEARERLRRTSKRNRSPYTC